MHVRDKNFVLRRVPNVQIKQKLGEVPESFPGFYLDLEGLTSENT